MKPLDKIVQKLIINGSLTDQPGLFYGKTGIVVFFFHYAQYTGNELFRDYAMDLIEDIRKQITYLFINRYDIGLAGIGVGFEYILQTGLLDAEDKNIFEEFDDRMYRTIKYEQYSNLSLSQGLTGWGRYFIYRLKGSCNEDIQLHKALTYIASEIIHKISKNEVQENEKFDVYRFFYDLNKLTGYAEKYSNILYQCMKWKCISELDIQKIFPYMNNLQRMYACQNYFSFDLTEEISREWKKWEETDNNTLMNVGLLNGWTSEALLHLTFSGKMNVSWINLL